MSLIQPTAAAIGALLSMVFAFIEYFFPSLLASFTPQRKAFTVIFWSIAIGIGLFVNSNPNFASAGLSVSDWVVVIAGIVVAAINAATGSTLWHFGMNKTIGSALAGSQDVG